MAVPARTDDIDLNRLGLHSGEAKRFDLEVELDDFTYGEQRYTVEPRIAPVVIDVSRMVGNGFALRLRFTAGLRGPCMRCLAPAAPSIDVDAREVDQPGEIDELDSPYITDDVLDARRWARDALALALPAQILCRPDCLGLCPECGADLNADPEHAHEAAPDPRWAVLDELKFD